MSLVPQSFLELAYSIPPVIFSLWGVIKTGQTFHRSSNSRRSDIDVQNALYDEKVMRDQLEKERWETLLRETKSGVELTGEVVKLLSQTANQIGVLSERLNLIGSKVDDTYAIAEKIKAERSI